MGCVLFTATAQGFDFNPEGQEITVIAVPERVTGEVWEEAVTESWQQTKNTVWAHCMDVVVSYGARKTDVEQCEEDVATVNNTTPKDLRVLQVGEVITLPLTREQAEEYGRVDAPTTNVEPVTDTQPQPTTIVKEETSASIEDLRDQVKLLEAEVGAVYSEFRQQGRKEDERFEALSAQLKALTETVTQVAPNRQAGVPNAMPATTIRQSEGNLVVFADQLRFLLLNSVWGPIIFFGAGLLLVLLIGGNVWRSARWRKMRQELKAKDHELLRYRLEFRKDDALLRRLEKDILRLEKELEEERLNFDFNEQEFEFDGKKYPIKLKAVTEVGKIYTTPTAEAVLEKNLKSHFAHAIKTVHRRAA